MKFKKDKKVAPKVEEVKKEMKVDVMGEIERNPELAKLEALLKKLKDMKVTRIADLENMIANIKK